MGSSRKESADKKMLFTSGFVIIALSADFSGK